LQLSFLPVNLVFSVSFSFFSVLSWLLFVFSFLVVAESVGVGVFLQKIWGLLVGHAVLICDGGGGLW
jgi:hypothetical protein